MSHFLHSLKAILLAYLRSNGLTLVSNRLKISLMVANNRTIAPQQYRQQHLSLCTEKSKRRKKFQNSSTVQVKIYFFIIFYFFIMHCLTTLCAVISEHVVLCTDVEVQIFFCTAIPVCHKKLLCRFCSLIQSGDQQKTSSNSLMEYKQDVNTAWTLLVDYKRRKQ